jgi:predicted ATPase
MRRILVTGVSGAGKSTVMAELATGGTASWTPIRA